MIIYKAKDNTLYVKTKGGWYKGHPDRPYLSPSYFDDEAQPIPEKDHLDALVSIADITATQVLVLIPAQTMREAKEIGTFLQSPQGKRVLKARMKRLNSKLKPKDEMNLPHDRKFISIPLEVQDMSFGGASSTDFRNLTFGEIEDMEAGKAFVTSEGVYLFKADHGGWYKGSLNSPTVVVSRDSQVGGKMKPLLSKDIAETLVRLASIGNQGVSIYIPLATQKQAEEIGRIILSPKGTKLLRARLDKFGEKRILQKEMQLSPLKSYIQINFKY